jgi:hypothetical protein
MMMLQEGVMIVCGGEAAPNGAYLDLGASLGRPWLGGS